MKLEEKILQLKKFDSNKGATEGEALAALEMADKLMKKHNITEEDLYKAQCETDMKKHELEATTKTIDPAYRLCGQMIAKLCDVRVWKHNEDIQIFGFNKDVELAEYLLIMLKDSMKYTWTEYKKANKPFNVSEHKAYWSFRYGFASKIKEKVDALVAERTVEQCSDGKSLVDLKNVMVEDGLRQMFPNLFLKESGGTKRKIHHDIAQSGANAADKISLGRPMNGGKQAERITHG